MSNPTLVLPAPKADFVLEEQSIPQPTAADDILIRCYAVGLNPVDHKTRDAGLGRDFPIVLGEEVAGVVEAVGSGVTGFKPGDRVTGFVHQMFGDFGGFRQHLIVNTRRAGLIPDDLSFQSAATIPMALTTAAGALYDLGIYLPGSPKGEPSDAKAVLIWSGGSVMGTTAVQLAHHSGMKIITTASPHHFDRLKADGADFVFDYRSPTVVEDIVKAAKAAGIKLDRALDCAVLDPVAPAKVLEAFGGGSLVTLTPADEAPAPGVKSWFSGAANAMNNEAFSKYLFHDFLIPALKDKTILPNAYEVIPGGLGGVEAGLAKMKAGISGLKLLIEP